jgi:hypothetical protein
MIVTFNKFRKVFVFLSLGILPLCQRHANAVHPSAHFKISKEFSRPGVQKDVNSFIKGVVGRFSQH